MRSRRVIVSWLLFLTGLIALDWCAAAILERWHHRVRQGEQIGVINNALASRDADVIVFGSSRARHHFDTEEMSRVLGGRVHNAGAQGQRVRYARMLEALLLSAGSKAHLFVLHLEATDLFSERPDREGVFGPYMHADTTVARMLRSRSPSAPMKYRSESYRFNSLLLPIVHNLLSDRQAFTSGFVPLHGAVTEAAKEVDRRREPRRAGEPDPPVLEHIDGTIREFVRAARAGGVEVVLVTGPRLWRSDELSALTPRARRHYQKIADDEGCTYLCLDESVLEEFARPALYRDKGHLNARGAAEFSRIVAERLAALYGREDGVLLRPGAREVTGRRVAPEPVGEETPRSSSRDR